jgi:hypothetical protein
MIAVLLAILQIPAGTKVMTVVVAVVVAVAVAVVVELQAQLLVVKKLFKHQ